MSDATIRTKILAAIDSFEREVPLDPVFGLQGTHALDILRSRIEEAFNDENKNNDEPSSSPYDIYVQNARREYGKRH
jgi:hypothetical protein